ncbi:hypothetical protein D3C71_1762400 [compost metagenome]
MVLAVVQACGVAWPAVEVFGGLVSIGQGATEQHRVVVIEQSLFRVPAAQDDRPGIPRVIMQIPVFVRPHDVVDAE